MVILGTQYAGEMKKGIFTVMHYLMPKQGILSLHSGCNVGAKDDVTLFFGLSGNPGWRTPFDFRACAGRVFHRFKTNFVFQLFVSSVAYLSENCPGVWDLPGVWSASFEGIFHALVGKL
jgi:phosphoenolpyruvate carboxykinase (ATP)